MACGRAGCRQRVWGFTGGSHVTPAFRAALEAAAPEAVFGDMGALGAALKAA
jgi:hypothetical protein